MNFNNGVSNLTNPFRFWTGTINLDSVPVGQKKLTGPYNLDIHSQLHHSFLLKCNL